MDEVLLGYLIFLIPLVIAGILMSKKGHRPYRSGNYRNNRKPW